MIDNVEVLRELASTVEALQSASSADVFEVLLLCQYLLTAYLTTVPALGDAELQILELVHALLPAE